MAKRDDGNSIGGEMMNTNEAIPKTCDVLVIGGGPAGSSISTLLAKAGLDVVLLEKAKHPRPQVGESLIPHFWKFADQLGVTEKLEKEGFLTKAGGIIAWNGKITQIKFSDFGYTARSPLHVERDRFDLILLRHAAESGARVWEEVAVRGVDFSGAQPCVLYEDRRGGNGGRPGRIDCQYVVDASGVGALLASQFRTRRLLKSDRKFLSLWGYYKNADYVGADGKFHRPEQLREVKPVTFVCSYQDGWAWHIILRDCTSVGLVMNTDAIKGKGKKAQEQYFREACESSIPYLRDLLAPATFIEGSMVFRPDYSYYNEKACGDNFFCIGDAAAFADPIFSQGVTAAMYEAALCAWALSASLKNPRRRPFYADIFTRNLLGFYGFARLLTLGDFGGPGIDPELVKATVKSVPKKEWDLYLSAATMNNRSEHVLRLAFEAGLLDQIGKDSVKIQQLSELTF